MELHEAYDVFLLKTESWLNKVIDHLPNLVLASTVIVVFFFLSRLLRGVGHRFVAHLRHNGPLVEIFSLFFSRMVLLLGVFIALNILGLNTAISSLLAGAGIVGLALGFAFQDLTANFISGVFIVAGQPIRHGDVIETNGYTGKVLQIKVRSAVIDNGSGQLIEIPSRKIIENVIINYSKLGIRRVQIDCEVAFGSDLEQVQLVTSAAVASIGLHYTGKPIEVHFSSFTGSGIKFFVWFWIHIEDETHPGIVVTTSKAIQAITNSFDKNGIRIPFPTQTIYMGKEN